MDCELQLQRVRQAVVRVCVFSFFVSFCLFGTVCCSVFVFVFAVESVGGALTLLVSQLLSQ